MSVRQFVGETEECFGGIEHANNGFVRARGEAQALLFVSDGQSIEIVSVYLRSRKLMPCFEILAVLILSLPRCVQARCFVETRKKGPCEHMSGLV